MAAKKELPERSRYRVIQVRMWGDQKFTELTPIQPCGQGLWIYLLTGPHTGPIPGIFRAGRAGLAESLRWEQEAFDKAFAEAFEQGMAKADWKAQLVWLPNAMDCNRPASPNVVISWGKEWPMLPECALKLEAFESLKASIHGLGEAFGKAFDKAFAKPSVKPSGKAFDMASGKTMAIQKQEQEQELTNSRRQYTAAGEPVDNSAEGREEQKNETTTEGNRTDSQNPNTESQESGAGGAADASDGSRHAEGGANGVAPGNREPDDDLPPLAVSTEWFRQRGVLIDDTNDLLIGWRRAGVTEGQFTVAIAKAKQYKLKHIPANYLAQIVDEMINPPERASKRIALGDDEQSLKAAAKALGMDEGLPGEGLKAYKARILERMNERRQPA
ncbi:hypothetical protein [Burkholderia ubonensis]|uniref:hypothetical protein n=1 Tax=Burkholderia ubonensis TaxID=101571 RepID=UPI00075E4266|nr:hypothetical protein [Burkholderia ubonensis]KVO11746.1 hypothetical protein WJ73_19555 [Burkholderia ubonensis]